MRPIVSLSWTRWCGAALVLLVVAPLARPQGSANTPINPMTGEPEQTEELRSRLSRLQIQSRIESELTSIERTRQERRHLGAGEPRAAQTTNPVLRSSSGATTSTARSVRLGRATGIDPPTGATANASPNAPAGVSMPGAPRLAGLVRDGDAQLAITESASGFRSGPTAPSMAPGSGSSTAALVDGAQLRIAQDPGHIDLPRDPSLANVWREDRAAAPDAAGATSRSAAERLGIFVPAHETPQ